MHTTTLFLFFLIFSPASFSISLDTSINNAQLFENPLNKLCTPCQTVMSVVSYSFENKFLKEILIGGCSIVFGFVPILPSIFCPLGIELAKIYFENSTPHQSCAIILFCPISETAGTGFTEKIEKVLNKYQSQESNSSLTDLDKFNIAVELFSIN